MNPPQANQGLSYLAQRPQVGMVTNNLQALALQQRAAAIRLHHPQQMNMAQQAAQAQFYNNQLRVQHARNQALLQGTHVPVIPNAQMVQRQIAQQQHVAQRQQQAQIPQQSVQQTQNIQQTQANVGGLPLSQQSTSQQ